MKIISFLNPKGGSGKTTAVINIATAMKRAGFNLAVVDTDPQMSLTNWSKDGSCCFDVYTASSEKDVYSIRKDLSDFDYVIVDGAGSLSVITSAAVMVSDLVIIPVTPSPLDFSAAGSVTAVLEAQSYNRKVESRFLITRKIDQAIMLNVLKENLKELGIQTLKTSISQRQVYIKSILQGDSVFESSDSAAKGEIEVLTKEVINILG
ncbi:ParA family protein [Providencia sp. PROV111]|uniref:ParA family protein n=1 Tax=Providencia sp. PROV111 TaxID=2949822 RepID=UPI00234A888B|nr:ParA family protein [Providencia sp. PROV111]